MQRLLPRSDIAFLIALGCAAACHKAPPPVAPGPPIRAEPTVEVKAMGDECNALLAAFEVWKACPNASEGEKKELEAQEDYAKLSFEASTKVELDAKQQHAIALGCQRATASVQAAAQRCNAGKPPPRNY